MTNLAPFKIDFVCPLETGDTEWRRYGGYMLFGRRFGGHLYRTIEQAAIQANALIWRYHKVRVIDDTGTVVYQL